MHPAFHTYAQSSRYFPSPAAQCSLPFIWSQHSATSGMDALSTLAPTSREERRVSVRTAALSLYSENLTLIA
jgi:hypothetical protein